MCLGGAHGAQVEGTVSLMVSIKERERRGETGERTEEKGREREMERERERERGEGRGRE